LTSPPPFEPAIPPFDVFPTPFAFKFTFIFPFVYPDPFARSPNCGVPLLLLLVSPSEVNPPSVGRFNAGWSEGVTEADAARDTEVVDEDF
jgi:hypothetical protein